MPIASKHEQGAKDRSLQHQQLLLQLLNKQSPGAKHRHPHQLLDTKQAA
jgi:hypothetical protein